MADKVEPFYRSSDSELATQLARLWPHRECEANIIARTILPCGVALVAAVGLIRACAGQRHSFLLFVQKSENRWCRARSFGSG
jgi:hypothetical protein